MFISEKSNIPTSEPPRFSVIHWPDVQNTAGSRDFSRFNALSTNQGADVWITCKTQICQPCRKGTHQRMQTLQISVSVSLLSNSNSRNCLPYFAHKEKGKTWHWHYADSCRPAWPVVKSWSVSAEGLCCLWCVLRKGRGGETSRHCYGAIKKNLCSLRKIVHRNEGSGGKWTHTHTHKHTHTRTHTHIHNTQYTHTCTQ